MKDELPPGWMATTLGDVAEPPRSKASPTSHPELPFVGMDSIAANCMVLVGTARFGDMKSNGGLFHDGDVLYGRMRPYLNKVHRAKFSGACSAEFIVFPESNAIDPDFLAYLLHHRKFVNFANSLSSGDRPRVDFGDVSQYEFELPPKPEQKRIASKIDELFSRIDEGERALKRVSMLVERYRQSVLKAAVTGELTRAWREKNKDTLESGEALLARILTARREAWEAAELEKMKAKGITPANDKWKQRFEEPSPPSTTDRPELPEGWAWCTGAQLFEWASGDFLPAKAMQSGNVPVYGGNGVNGQHSEANVDFSTIVVGRVGVHCGNVHISAAKSWVTDNAIYATRLPALASLDYLLVCLRSAQLGNTSQGGAQPFVNQKALNEVVIPLPPVEEQVAAVDVLASETSRLDSVLASVEVELRRMAVLKQAVLKFALSGALVAHDPSDEPASVLLERIGSLRGEDTAAPKCGRRKKTTP